MQESSNQGESDRRSEAPNAAYVYFAVCLSFGNKLVKIGKAKNPKQRLKELQAGCPFPMKLALTLDYDSAKDAHSSESELHKLLAHHKINGEWFAVRDDFHSLVDEFVFRDEARREFLNAFSELT